MGSTVLGVAAVLSIHETSSLQILPEENGETNPMYHWNLIQIIQWAMRILSITGWWGRVYSFFQKCEESALFRYITKPFVLGVPPLLITAFYSNKGVAAVVSVEFPLFAGLLADYSVYAIVFAGLYPGIILATAQTLTNKAQPKGPDAVSLLALLSTIDGVVGAKLNRFSEHFLKCKSLTKETAFCAITHPDKQIEELVRGVCEFFNASQSTKKRGLIRVVLAVMDGERIAALPIFFPHDEPVRASVEELNNPRSAIRLAALSKKILVIDDIEKELKKPIEKCRFTKTENDDDQSGSLICYPVKFDKTREVPFVISIHSEQPGFFQAEKAKVYELYLQRFAIRLSLEYSLLKLKESFIE